MDKDTSPSKSNRALLKIVAGWLIAVGIAISNHLFFSHLNGKNAAMYTDAVINSAKNALATITQLLLVYVEKESLVQITWSYLYNRSLTLGTLDSVFGLPTIFPLINLIFSRRILLLGLLLLISVFTLSMALISVFVPASLSVAEGRYSTEHFKVPVIDLKRDYNRTLASWGTYRSSDNEYNQPAPLLQRIIEMTISTLRPLSLDPPEKCKLGCKYSFSYDVIAMKCKNLDSSEIWNDPTRAPPSPPIAFLQTGDMFTRQGYLLNATVTSDPNNTADAYRYTVAYLEWSMLNDHRSSPLNILPYIQGVTCTFHNATYLASINFSPSLKI
ncbi:hypothetical protein CPB86DRAFT_798126 [Serendipita vermifera]|nr:hypothetical protein CPB86DRAFT_798126 [Serendipita vermifera]